VEPQNNKDEREPNKVNFRFSNNRFALFFLIALVVMFVLLFVFNDSTQTTEIAYSTFLAHLEEGNVDSVKIFDQSDIQGP
jgi:cell division protease FtsH